MSYSQVQSIDLMKAGKFPGEEGIPKHIQTVISNVFLFEKKVYKFYKNNNDFFNNNFRNLSSKEERFSFTKKDFDWNSKLSPSIYIELKNIDIKNNDIVEVEEKDAEEIIMIMNRVDTGDMLYEKLIKNEISNEDCLNIGKQFAKSIARVQTKLPQEYNFYDLFGSRIKDTRDWIASVTDYISTEEANSYCNYLEEFRNDNKTWFENELSSEISRDGDFHSHNAIYSNCNFLLMDTYPPKEEWGIGHRFIGLYRLGTDIWALSGKQEFFESFIKGYEEGGGIKIDRRLDNLYIIYSACIAMPYLYMLSKNDLEKKDSAEKFHKFTREYFAKIK